MSIEVGIWLCYFQIFNLIERSSDRSDAAKKKAHLEKVEAAKNADREAYWKEVEIRERVDFKWTNEVLRFFEAEGELPQTQTNLPLQYNELCHLLSHAQLLTHIQDEGKLAVTSTRVVFAGKNNGTHSIKLTSIIDLGFIDYHTIEVMTLENSIPFRFRVFCPREVLTYISIACRQAGVKTPELKLPPKSRPPNEDG